MMRAREIFEPILLNTEHDIATTTERYLRENTLLRDYQLYIPPDASSSSRYFQPIQQVLRGRVHNDWCDKGTRSGIYRRRLIKDIRANLLLAYLARTWPRLKIIWIVRDVMSAIESQLNMVLRFGWSFSWEPQQIISQARLTEDWLSGYVPLMQTAATDAERLAHRWCIETMVPFWQNVHKLDNVLLVRDEELINDVMAWEPVFRLVPGIRGRESKFESVASHPSRTARHVNTTIKPSDSESYTLTNDERTAIARIVDSYNANIWARPAALLSRT
jgi:hypothetical protein